jgi:hypothetical protein
MKNLVNVDSMELFLFTEHLCHQLDLSISEITATVGRYQYQKQLEQRYGNRPKNATTSVEWMKTQPSLGLADEANWLLENSIDTGRRPKSRMFEFVPSTFINVDEKSVHRSKPWLKHAMEVKESIRNLDSLLVGRKSASFTSSTESLVAKHRYE